MTQKKSSSTEKNTLSTAFLNKVLIAKQAKQLHDMGVTYRGIARQLGISRVTVKKYVEGDLENVCLFHRTVDPVHQFGLDEYSELVLSNISSGVCLRAIHGKVCENGYEGSYETFCRDVKRLAKNNGMCLKHGKCVGTKEKSPDIITRAGVFKHLWEGLEITPEHLDYIYSHYNSIGKLDRCIKEFRYIFKHQSIPLLYCFIDTYSNCGIKPLESFAKGLLNDIDAVENAVSMNLSNGFVEGTNSKTKMIKRTMYGRCSLPLLRAKIILSACR